MNFRHHGAFLPTWRYIVFWLLVVHLGAAGLATMRLSLLLWAVPV